jgi:hypothetical protein
MIQTRKDIRVPVSLTSRYRIPTRFDYVEALCNDLSRSGMFIESSSPVERNTLLKIECEVRDREAPITGVGRVVWHRGGNGKNGGSGPTGMGVKFVKLDPSSDRVIAGLIETSGQGQDGVGGERLAVKTESEGPVREEPIAEGDENREGVGEKPAAGKQETEVAVGEASAAERGEEESDAAVDDSHRVSPAPLASRRRVRAVDLIMIGLMALAFLAAALTLMLP